MTNGSPTVDSAALFDQLADFVASYELDGTIRYVNPEAVRMFGCKHASELLGHNLWQVLPSSKGTPFQAAFLRVAETGKPEHFELHFQPWRTWFSNYIFRSATQVWVFAHDITEQKRGQLRLEVLADSSRAFAAPARSRASAFESIAQHLAQTIPDACAIRLVSADGAFYETPIAVWDEDPAIRAALSQPARVPVGDGQLGAQLQDGRVVVANSLEEVAARATFPTRLAAREALGVHSAIVAPMQAHGETLGLLTLFRRRGGTAAPFTAQDVQLVQELASRAALVASQWRTFELVDQARQRALAIGDALPALVSLIDRDLRYQFVNATYTAWFGLDASKIIGRHVPEVLGHEAFGAVEDYMRRGLAGETVSYEARLNYKTGPRDIQGTYTPYRVGGRVEGIVVLVVDVTERVRQSAELRAATEAREEFLSIASHELRTPLTTLELQLDALKRTLERNVELDRAGARKKLEVALSQTTRLTSLVDELLSVARTRSGQVQVRPVEFEVTELLQDLSGRFEAASRSSGTPLSLTGLTPTRVTWDRELITQALKNLLNNAFKYGPGKPVELSLLVEGERVRVSVRDEGIGVSNEARARIFERFERAVPSSNYGGLGLGLYLTRQIATAHGGGIALESTPGQGARFTLDLPRHAR